MTRKFLLSSTGGGVHGMYGYHAEKRARQGGNHDRITLVAFAHHNVILQETSFNWNPGRHAVENIGEPLVELVEIEMKNVIAASGRCP
ncbi:MAG TPA: hypothetical protein VKG87_05670, partial [Terriglobales bacterium]|nr:hypothetical protein [Terriglobales bacterium]